MRFPSKEQVARVRQMYPAGAKVECISIDDPYVQIPSGTIGAVYGVDVIRRVDKGDAQ